MKHNPIFKIIQLGFQFALCAMAFSFGSAHAQEYFLIKSKIDQTKCIQDYGQYLQIQQCDPLNEKQRWKITSDPRGIVIEGGEIVPVATRGGGTEGILPFIDNNNKCLGLYQEKTTPGTPVVEQDCRNWLRQYLNHNFWVKEKINIPEARSTFSTNNFICFGSDYKSKFADSQSLDKIENTIGGKYTNLHPGGISGSFFLTGRFCTNPQRWMAGDLIFVKIPANTISCAGQEGGRPKNCQDYRNNKNYILVKAKTDFPNGGGWKVEPHPAVRSFFIQENGKYKYIEDKNVVDYLTQDLFTLIQIKAASQGAERLLETPINNPPNKVLEIYIEVRNHPNKNFSLGSARLVDFVPIPAMSASEVTAKCGDKDIRGAIGIGSGNDITTRFQGDFRCSGNEKFTLRSSPFVRAKVEHDFEPIRGRLGYRHGFAVCKGDAFTSYDLHRESIINEPNTQTFKIPRSQPNNSLYQWTLGDTLQASKIGKGPGEPPPCQFIRDAVRLPDGSFECVNCSVPFYYETNLIWAFQLYDHPSTPNVAPDPIINWHYMQLVGGFFVRDSSKSQPSPPPPPSTPLPTPPPQSSAEPVVKETFLYSKALKPEIGVRQEWLRPNYGNLAFRKAGYWSDNVGVGKNFSYWDTPAYINWRKINEKALFANHPNRSDYYPDGVIPIINYETEITYSISHTDISKLIKERGYNDAEVSSIIKRIEKNEYISCTLRAAHFLKGSQPTEIGNAKEFLVMRDADLFSYYPYRYEGRNIEGRIRVKDNPLIQQLSELSARIPDLYPKLNVTREQGFEFVTRIECKIAGIKKGNTTENFVYHSKERSFIWQEVPYVIFLTSKNDGDENSLFTFDSSFLGMTEWGKWGINGGLISSVTNNPLKADLDKSFLCIDNKLCSVYTFDPESHAINIKRSLSPRERYSTTDKDISAVLNHENNDFSRGSFFTVEVNYGAGDVLDYPDGKKTEPLPRAFGPVWATPNSKQAKNYLRQLRPNIDPKILEARWLERQKYLRSNNFDNQSISRSLAYCNWEKNGERGFNARARYGFPKDPKGILSDLANDLEGKCTWLDKPLPSEIVKTNPPPDVLPPAASTCNQQLAPTCASNPRFSKIRFGAYYFRDAATSARAEPFNIYLRENGTYVIGEREDLPSVSGNYFICGDKIHFQNFPKIGTFTSQNQLQIESFLPGLAGIQKVFLCSGNACRTEGEVPVASKLCQPKFIQISPPPPVKPEPLPEQEKKPALQPITPPQVGEQPRKPLPEIITPIQIPPPPPPPPTSVPGDTGGFRQLPPGAISAPVPIPPPAIIPPPPSSVPRDTGFGQSRPVPISPPTIVPPPPVQPAPQPVAKPTPPQTDNKPVPVKKPEPVAAPQPKPTVPPAKKEPEFSVPIAR
jgi:hypothetical protein